MCCGDKNTTKMGDDSSSELLVSPSSILTAPGANCPDFPANFVPCNGDVIVQCYNQTGCYGGRQLSSPIQLPGGDYWVQYKVNAISDSKGLFYNVPSQAPTDLNISFYQDNGADVDFQLCGAGGNNTEYSTVLAGGQDIWFCGYQTYYIGANSGDTANIPTTQFYVCLQFQVGEPSSTDFNYMRIEQYGKCRTHECSKPSSGK